MEQFNVKSLLFPATKGLVAFAFASVLASVMILKYDNYFAAAILTGGLGALLLSFLTFTNKLIFWKMALAGSIGMPVGLLLSFLFVGGIGELVPTLGNFFENTPVPDIVAVVMMSSIYGMFVGGINFGKRSIGRFAIICGLMSVPAGLLVSVFNADGLQVVTNLFGEVDLNFVTIMLFIGLGIGVAIGSSQRFRHFGAS
ncbi:MAG TPA: hypothetical protein VLS94_09695 [Fusibacter sp.]|nr:hypothetical protein [Fusibacter sp.]